MGNSPPTSRAMEKNVRTSRARGRFAGEGIGLLRGNALYFAGFSAFIAGPAFRPGRHAMPGPRDHLRGWRSAARRCPFMTALGVRRLWIGRGRGNALNPLQRQKSGPAVRFKGWPRRSPPSFSLSIFFFVIPPFGVRTAMLPFEPLRRLRLCKDFAPVGRSASLPCCR